MPLEELNQSPNGSDHSVCVHTAQENVHFCLYQIFAPSCKLCIPLGRVAVYLTYLLSLEFPGMMSGAVCRVGPSGLVKSGWYRYHFWRNSSLIACLCTNIFHDRAGKWWEGMFEAEHPKENNSMQTSRLWLRCSALDCELQPGEPEQDPNKGEK